MQLLYVLQNAVGNKEMYDIRHADDVAVRADQSQQVNARCTVSLRSQQVVECALREGVAREVGRVVGDDRRAYDVRVVDVIQWTRDRLGRHHVHLEGMIQRQRSLQVEIRRRPEYTKVSK